MAHLFKADAEKIEAVRKSRQLKFGDSKIEKFETYLAKEKIELEGRKKYKQMLAERENLFKAKATAEQQEEEVEENKEQGENEEEL